ncbi:palmitoyltransferase ZDHHC20 isoform X1 [Equus quagga]|uniref:palmitoyltransferase ZDHHC20 isoform X1 n=2 Tax=Equus quagga TaxID=89248 RepID=UPI001EE30826|nr:palmitoyltransferase ZDHHC20 isoform X1 [Equus quagga]
MAPWTFWRCCQRTVGWVPVFFIAFVVAWSYYAYVVELCVVTLSGNGENGKAVVYLVGFHLFFVMFVWSYWMTIFTSPASPSKEFYLSSSDKERYEKEFNQERQQEILRRTARDLPIYTVSAARTIRYCERCQLIKPDRAHHCSACDICVLKMDHHCPWVNNCVGFSNYKFFLLFLLYSLLYCLFVATTVLQCFIKFWTLCRRKSTESCAKNELSATRAKFHVLFLFFVSTMFFISVLSLFSYHCWLVGKNRTTIESFRAPTFSYGPDGNGFSLGCSKNWRQVFGDEKKYWLLPIFSSLGDGCSFPTRLVGMDPEQASVSNQNEYARSIGSNQPFPVKPLSESKNRLLDSESQWLENGSEESTVRSGTNNHVTVAIEN